MSNLLIRHLEQFGPLSADEKQALASLVARVQEIGADRDIVAEGDRPDDCKLILEGFVCRYKLLPRGRRQIMSIQIPGDVVDLQGVLLGQMDHSLGTLTATKIGVIPHDRLLETTERFPRIARALWQSTLIDSAVFREWMVGLGRRSALQRIAHLLCEMFFRLRAVGLTDNGSYEFPITQAEIADCLGLSTVHVNRSLQALRRKQLISFQSGRVAIHDWEGLKAAGEFESRYLHVGRDASSGRRKMARESGSPEVR
jgi:CRP-like cAMP-binding protein